jgi:hypothetical protein
VGLPKDFESLEKEFISNEMEKLLKGRPLPVRPGYPPRSPYDVPYLEELERRLDDDALQDDAAFEAVKNLGLAVLNLRFVERRYREERTDVAVVHLRAVHKRLWDVIGKWWVASRVLHEVKGRRFARRQLKKLGDVLGRGSRAVRLPTYPTRICRGYFMILFQVGYALKLIRTTPEESRLETVNELCRAFSFEREFFRQMIGLDADGRLHRPQSPEAIAKTIAAGAFGLSESTLSNYLATYPRRPQDRSHKLP